MEQVQYRQVSMDEILPFRDALLIKPTGRVDAEFPGDRDADTMHWAAFIDDRIVGFLTLIRSSWEGAPAWQLRGMGILERWQGRGLGAGLLGAALAEAWNRESPAPVWCNARSSAVGFYLAQGFHAVSEEFMTDFGVLHYRMVFLPRIVPDCPGKENHPENRRK